MQQALWSALVVALAAADAATVLEVGEGLKMSGRLDRDKRQQAYRLKLQEGGTYVIDMVSPGPKTLDPFLRLLDASGRELAADDDSGGGLNALILFTAPSSGVYQLVATSFDRTGSGSFTVRVKRDDRRHADALEARVRLLISADKTAEALAVVRLLATAREREQGPKHWQTIGAVSAVRDLAKLASLSGSDRAELADAEKRNARADALRQKHQYAEATPVFDEVLSICRRILGEEHSRTVRSYNNLAVNLDDQGRYAEATSFYQRALASCRKTLGEEHPDTALSHNNLGANLKDQGKYAEAAVHFGKALALYRKLFGDEHLATARACNNLAGNLLARGNSAQAVVLFRKALAVRRKLLGEDHADTARALGNLASALSTQARYAEAAALDEQALTIRRRVLGEEHPETALAYNNLAVNLDRQSKYAQAALYYEKALAISRKILGEEHPGTARAYHNLAANLNAQGQYAAAALLYERGLAIHRKILGEDHPATAISYIGLAENLEDQGRYAEAALFQEKALAIHRKVLGEEHPGTAGTYNNLAGNLDSRGKHAEATPLYERALAIRRRSLGEQEPHTAQSYNNLGFNLKAQGKSLIAAGFYQKALAIYRQTLGEKHPDTATAYDNLAGNLNAHGDYAGAMPLYEKALAIRRGVLGVEHPDTARSLDNVANSLHAQGRYMEAAPLFAEALAVRRKVLGDEHPDTALTYHTLARNLAARGRYAEAEQAWVSANRIYSSARLRSAHGGLERAWLAVKGSPALSLAASLARNGKPTHAWQTLEASLARGLLEAVSAGPAFPRPITIQEARRERQLLTTLRQLDEQILHHLTTNKKDKAAAKQYETMLAQHRKAREELAKIERTVTIRQVYDLQRIQTWVPPDAAFIAWVDIHGEARAQDPNGEHWACVLRHSGQPTWIKLPGSGPQGGWTDQDDDLCSRFRQALSSPGEHSAKALERLRTRLRAQRLRPLEPALAARGDLPAVTRLLAVPAAWMAGIPVDALTDRYLVTYVPSGTMFARLREKPPQGPASAGRLLALGDPVFRTLDKVASLPPPKYGLLIVKLVPGANAAKSGLKLGDVLVSYDGKQLTARQDLVVALKQSAGKPEVATRIWRDGTILLRKVAAGPLGVSVSKEAAKAAILARSEADRIVRGARGAAYLPLPGTRAEVAGIARLFPHARTLLQADASEQQLYALLQKGELKRYRFLHFATHGEVDNRIAFNSALILAQDRLPHPAEALVPEAFLDGRLTAEEISKWTKDGQPLLDADLVVLSACQSGLGRKAGGEGYLGFSQALFLAGARSLVVSLWKVDDISTSLLMVRFYENLLGRRAGLKVPMPKAEALSEAKRWLRGLTAKEVEALAKDLPAVERIGTASGRPRPATVSHRPYEHPYYWAAFILIGDPR